MRVLIHQGYLDVEKKLNSGKWTWSRDLKDILPLIQEPSSVLKEVAKSRVFNYQKEWEEVRLMVLAISA